MRGILSLLLVLNFVRPALAFSELDDIRLRPSYQQLFKACQASDFKLDSYYKAYVQSLTSGLAFISLSQNGVKNLMASNGVSPYLNALLENPTTSVALQDCLGDSDEESAFVRNMLIADSAGKVVAISIAAVAIKGAGKLMGGTMKALNAISPTLARRVMIASVIASSSYAFSQLMKEKKEQESASSVEIPDIETTYSQKLVETATEQLAKLHELMGEDLNPEDREQVEREIHNWTIILEQFKPKAS
ncbi:hypothetical protein [Bdellovibrio sp. HCB2-146]|uniref:hypothetical protein n=1 Tax=Bdellovibrio sp. HCB2-146 TaxID=3394362 RepID=UPI0039BCEE5F